MIVIKKENNNLKLNGNNKNTNLLEANYYINNNLLTNVINRINFVTKDIIQINKKGDGNYFMKCLVLFIYNDENYHPNARNEIVNYIEILKKENEKIEIETIIGDLKINEYIQYIKNLNAWERELEK